MRRFLAFAVLAACGAEEAPATDAAIAVDAPDVDAPDIDAPPCPPPLLAGGVDVTTQGWTAVTSGAATLTYGADYTRVETMTASSTSGHLLLTHAALTPPFEISFELMIERVSPHNSADSAAGILGAFTPPFGMPAERMQMIYLDGDRVGFADDSQSFAFDSLDGAYHTYTLAVDAAATATLHVDGALALTRASFLLDSTFALGDQTNDPNVDSAFRIRAITTPCPAP